MLMMIHTKILLYIKNCRKIVSENAKIVYSKTMLVFESLLIPFKKKFFLAICFVRYELDKVDAILFHMFCLLINCESLHVSLPKKCG